LTTNTTDAPCPSLGRANRRERIARVYRGLHELTYPFHDKTIAVTHCGRICFNGHKVNLSHVFAGQNVGVRQVSERMWLVTGPGDRTDRLGLPRRR